MNLITDEKRRQAIRLAKLGISVSIERDLSTEAAPDNPAPFELKMGNPPRVDTWAIRYHGTYVTHFDALCHFAYKDMLYNGVPFSASNDKGCAIGVEHFKNGVITRGILLDIPRLKGVPYLEPGTTVSIAEVEAWEKKAGVKIGPGDAVILRTGRFLRRAKVGAWKSIGNAAGFHASVARLLRQRDVALTGADATAEAQNTPPIIIGAEDLVGRQPLHTALISSVGMALIDDMDPEALAEMCAKLNRWEFMFVVLPISVPGGTGGPVNPIAIF
jgi:kynurenine formamidase